MCTVLILFQAHPAAPLFVAANRDEFYARPTQSPTRLLEHPQVAVGGRDLRHGGSWMGLNSAGLMATLTNMPEPAPGEGGELRPAAQDARRSRGEIVTLTLACGSPDQVIALLRDRAQGGEYRPFNLLFGDARSLHVAYHRDGGLRLEAVEPGAHVLASGGRLDDPDLPKVARAQRLLGEAAGSAGSSTDSVVSALYDVLADTETPDPETLPPGLWSTGLRPELAARLQAINVQTRVYGTRSSGILVLGPSQRRYYHGEGAPPVPLVRVDGLLGKPGERAQGAQE